ncbi:alpha/beta hydrolase [Pontibacter sp. G13]|uniref:alpha/beta hydrolase n=1 Tax=Pontibacter sp. G13 TaxID=3074898 RepID=UPI00288C4B07|nr:alpha/beta hydrolase [Pontibacter sp. G13]WNJ18031.1 alpha/beta hydrolase [Pontibacter sp. G13]
MRSSFIALTALISMLFMGCSSSEGPEAMIAEYFHVEVETAHLPVLVRGNIGSDKLLIYLQGGPGGSALDFAEVDYPYWKETLEQSYAIAYYDQRGTGTNQGKLDLETITIEQYIADVRAIVEVLSIRYPDAELYLMGHSFGGYLAMEYLATYTGDERIKATMSIDGPITNDSDPERWGFRQDYLENLAIDQLQQGGDSSIWVEALGWVQAIDTIDSREARIQWNTYVSNKLVETERPLATSEILRMLFNSPYGAIPAYMDGKVYETLVKQLFEDWRDRRMIDRLDQIRAPIWLISGRYDDIVPPEEMAFAAANLIHASVTLEIFPESGHEPFMDAPADFAAKVHEMVDD